MNRTLIGIAVLLTCAATSTIAIAQQAVPRASQRQLSLMPVPSSVTLRDGSLVIDSTFRVAIVGHSDARLVRAVARMIPRLEYRTGIAMSRDMAHDSAGATLVIDCQNAGEPVQGIDENESYSIESGATSITLRATTTVGIKSGSCSGRAARRSG